MLLLNFTAAATAQQWVNVAPTTGYTAPQLMGVNANGSLIGGVEVTNDGLSQNVFWSPAGGKVIINPSPLGFIQMSGSCDTGLWVGSGLELQSRGYYRTAEILSRDGHVTSIGRSSNYEQSLAYDCDVTCTTVVGVQRSYVRTGNTSYSWYGRPFVWTPTGGRVELPHAVSGANYTTLVAVSRDGRIAAGYSGYQSGGVAVTWTASGGYQRLPLPPGSPASNQVTDMSGDGNVVVGTCYSAPGSSLTAVYWDAAGGHFIDTSGWNSRGPTLTNGNGSIIVGMGSLLGVPNSPEEGWVYTAAGGVRSAYQFLLGLGVPVPGDHNVVDIRGMSADGRTFCGIATNPVNGDSIGYVAIVPSPGAFLAIGAAGLVCVRRRRRTAAASA
jgi:hypothetical protein